MAPELVLGFGLGFAVAAPIGPMAMLCIGRAMREGVWAGFATGLGAATVHGFFGALAALGLHTVYGSRLAASIPYLSVGGALLLCWFAARQWKRGPASDGPTPVAGRGLLGAYATACLFGLCNPATVLLFLSSLPIVLQRGTALEATPFVIGVFIGSLAWWQGLSFAVGTLRARLGPRILNAINRLSAIILALFATWLLAAQAGAILPALSQVSTADHFGFAGGAMTLLAFAQTQMLRMRLAAVAANVFFIAFGLLSPAHPVLALHVILLPLNLYHLAACLPAGWPWPRLSWQRSNGSVR